MNACEPVQPITTPDITRQHRAGRTSVLAAPYLLLSPFLLVFAVFFLWPLVQSVAMSFRSYSGPGASQPVGLAHYRYLLRDPLFLVAIANTFSYALLFLLLQIPLSLALAVAVNSRSLVGRSAFRLAMLLPFLAGNVLAAILLTLLVAPRHGLINRAIAMVTPSVELNWKSDPILATLAIVLAVLWLTVGWGMVYLLAALQSVRPELYQAAEIDGAGAWQRLRHVTLPGIRPVLAYLVLVGTVGGLQLFELPYLFFEGLGPRLRGLTIMQYLALSGFDKGDLGLASAVGWVLVLLISLVALPQLRRLGKGDGL